MSLGFYEDSHFHFSVNVSLMTDEISVKGFGEYKVWMGWGGLMTKGSTEE